MYAAASVDVLGWSWPSTHMRHGNETQTNVIASVDLRAASFAQESGKTDFALLFNNSEAYTVLEFRVYYRGVGVLTHWATKVTSIHPHSTCLVFLGGKVHAIFCPSLSGNARSVVWHYRYIVPTPVSFSQTTRERGGRESAPLALSVACSLFGSLSLSVCVYL